MAAADKKETPAPTSAPAPRVIPGLNPSAAAQPAKAKRSRGGAGKKAPGDLAAAVTAAAVADAAVAPTAEDVATPLVAPEEELEVATLEAKKSSAVETCIKRIRASTKKLQRINQYEEKVEALNTDQKKAIASKPAVEATLKELNELLVVLKTDEAEDASRIARIKDIEAKKHKKEIDDAVAKAKVDSRASTVMLLQFMHMHSLYNESDSAGFAPTALPPALQNATGQEVAAIRSLHHALTNGPLLSGGSDDALEKVEKIMSGSSEEVIPTVSYSRVKELIHGLTAPPEPAAPAAPAAEAPLEAPMASSTVSVVSGQPPSALATPSFLQPSEIDNPPQPPAQPLERVTEWAEQVAPPSENGLAPPPETTTGTVDVPLDSQATPTLESSSKFDWSADDGQGGLPEIDSLELKTVPASAPAPATAPAATAPNAPADDGFQPAPSRNQRGRGAPRGGQRGGRGENPARRGSSDGRGRGRGGRGRGNGERGGRGGNRGQPREPREQPAPAPTA